MTQFIDLLQKRWLQSGRMLCVGLDPSLSKMPKTLAQDKRSFFDFARDIVDATAPYVCAFKPQIAYYAAYAAEAELAKTIDYIKSHYADIPIILDAKRGDIGDTAKMYAIEAFERYGADAVTVNPYMGQDTIEPYLNYADKGVVILCRTSNFGSGQLQALQVDGKTIAAKVAQMALELTKQNPNIALVVGATYTDELKQIRDIVGEMPLLVPGIGAQGGDLQEVMRNGLNQQQNGLIINSSRAVIYASNQADYAKQAEQVCQQYVAQMQSVLQALSQD